MKLISWNVNGLRSVITKGFEEFFKNIDADIFSIQETKMQEDQLTDEINNIFEGYYAYWNSALKKGYSGTAVFTKKKPINVTYGIGIEEHDQEGRIITLEFDNFYLVDCYTPNSKRELERLDYRQEIDLKNPKTNTRNAGFTIEERNKMTELLNAGFVDTFRYLYPNKEDAYTWWSYMFHAREKNVGWRIDYFIVSKSIEEKIKESKIHSEVYGSDHCPIELDLTMCAF